MCEPMDKHTAWRTGGAVKQYFKPADIDDLGSFLSQLAEDEPLLLFGLGSNLLVRDGGLQGTAIKFAGVLNDLQVDAERRLLHSGASVTCAKVARESAKFGLTGAEFLAGIPGTMGGALAMNAGAFGKATWDLVKSAETINRNGQRTRRSATDFEVGYRHLRLPKNEWFIAAELSLAEDRDGQSLQRIRVLLNQRAATQPTGQISCGSVFLNPPNHHAAKLIEASGLKGKKIGDAYVSKKHANFIINSGHASAGDIESLIWLIQKKVKHDHGITLIPEVRIVGAPN